MSQIVLKNVNYDKIYIKEGLNKYNLHYKEDFNIIGIPILCNGSIVINEESYKFYLDDKTYEILNSVQKKLKDKLVISIKQTQDTLKEITDIHLLNFCNLSSKTLILCSYL